MCAGIENTKMSHYYIPVIGINFLNTVWPLASHILTCAYVVTAKEHFCISLLIKIFLFF